MDQSRIESLVETIINTLIGLVVAIASQIVVFPLVGIHVGLSTNLEVAAYFTLISVARGYIIRRWFNARLKAAARRLAATYESVRDKS